MMDSFVPVAKPYIGPKEKEYVQEAVQNGWISSAGEFIQKFEQLNADFNGVKYGVAVSNGTVALHLALVALGIGPGDEVIIPNLTFAATANAVLYTGATPVLADVEFDSWTINIDKAEKLVNESTRAIIPVHLYGQPCDMKKIMAFSKKYDLYVIEDCAEAHGAEYNGSRVGSFGNISCFSFYGNKIITCGEGGICLTNDLNLYEKMNELRDHGMSKKRRYWHNSVGFNYRMTNIQAAVGCAQIERINEILEKRWLISKYYNECLKPYGIFQLQSDCSDRKKVCWLYTVLVDLKKVDQSIDDLRNKLHEFNIDSRTIFFPLHQMPPYKNLKKTDQRCSIEISKRGISLPTFEELPEKTIEDICGVLIKITGAL